jgi:hypothetical protein
MPPFGSEAEARALPSVLLVSPRLEKDAAGHGPGSKASLRETRPPQRLLRYRFPNVRAETALLAFQSKRCFSLSPAAGSDRRHHADRPHYHRRDRGGDSESRIRGPRKGWREKADCRILRTVAKLVPGTLLQAKLG